MSHQVCALGIGCLAALFVLSALPGRLLKVMPPPVWVFLARHAGQHIHPEVGQVTT